MSKMGQAVFEGQEFAQQHYNLPRDEFITLVNNTFKSMTVEGRSALDEYETIHNDLSDYAAYVAECHYEESQNGN